MAAKTIRNARRAFALANLLPEVQPEELSGITRVIATSRSDYANKIKLTDVNETMQPAAAEAIAGLFGCGRNYPSG
jgi:malic enzyme